VVSIPLLYYPGMVMVRLSRIIRTWYYKPGAPMEMKVVQLAGRIKMKVDRNSYMGGSIYWTGFHHLQELLYLDKRLNPNMIFVDVGANQGEFALFAASKTKQGKVLAFEPVTKNRKLLLENIGLNTLSNVDVYPFGLSDQKGSLPIYTSLATEVFHGQHEGLSTLYPSEVRNVLEETISLEVYDDYFNLAAPKVDFIKIDVEGAELFVLRGMRSMLQKCKPELLIEINEETFNAAGYTTNDVVRLLEEYGYVPFKLKKGNVEKINFAQISAWGNYIFRAGA
jgi:FkbM family methyltransferase